MKIIPTHSSPALAEQSSGQLREKFLLTDIFRPGDVSLAWWETDRTVMGGVCPLADPVTLAPPPELRVRHFFERREGGFVNLGGPGVIRVDGTDHRLGPLDALYVGRGAKQVSFSSDSDDKPARFWMLSYPAHAAHPTRHVSFSEVKGERLGAHDSANERTIHKLIHPAAFPTCQIVMGITRLEPGSVWNTMPPHTHLRRSEVYHYFDLPAGQAVFHFIGEPRESRHVIVRNGEAVLSPPWSIHCGVGTSNYSFVWGMGGENQEFSDMDPAPIDELR